MVNFQYIQKYLLKSHIIILFWHIWAVQFELQLLHPRLAPPDFPLHDHTVSFVTVK